MNRRSLVYGGVAAAAGLAGAGAAWWNNRSVTGHPAGGAEALPAPAEAAFWNLSFDSPQGQPVSMSSFRGKPLLVNFWATWCPPCVEELPLLDSFYSANKASWHVLGLAVDQPSAVRKWLEAKPLGFSVAMAGLDGTDLSKSLGNQAGGLPFTVVFSAGGALVQRKVGKVSPEDLASWLKA